MSNLNPQKIIEQVSELMFTISNLIKEPKKIEISISENCGKSIKEGSIYFGKERSRKIGIQIWFQIINFNKLSTCLIDTRLCDHYDYNQFDIMYYLVLFIEKK